MTDRDTGMAARTLAQTLALVFGIVFLGAGVLGFIPGITTNLGDIKFAGNDSPSELLGIFQVSILHNIVHLLFGIAGIAMARTWQNARTYLLGAGVIYLVLFVYGLIVGGDDDANFVPINSADDWLHLALGVVLLGSWFISGREEPTRADRDRTVTTTP
jgi:ABC-type transport system involved in multi-copper enzyme maturation permease subunit